MFDAARSAVLGGIGNSVRGVVVSGGEFLWYYYTCLNPMSLIILYAGPLELSYITPARIALSVPLVNSYIHPLVTGPVLASHALDLQIFPSPPQNNTDPFTFTAHVGSPSINVEAKLINVQDQSVENGEDPIGVLLVRGPSVAKVLGVGEFSYIEVPSSPSSDEGWVRTGGRARVLPNGAFKVATDAKR